VSEEREREIKKQKVLFFVLEMFLCFFTLTKGKFQKNLLSQNANFSFSTKLFDLPVK
jgi:hypothetical protein